MSQTRTVIVVGGHSVTVFDQHDYIQSKYDPEHHPNGQIASVDHNKILRPSYGAKIHYQRLALESREEWLKINKDSGSELFVGCGMLRAQPSAHLGALEKETLANMERDGLRDTQFVKSNTDDRQRAADRGWQNKLLDFNIPGEDASCHFEAVLDSLSGFVKCSEACAYLLGKALSEGVNFVVGADAGSFQSLAIEGGSSDAGRNGRKVVGIKTGDGIVHYSDTVIIAGKIAPLQWNVDLAKDVQLAGSFSTQILPDLSYHLESSAGSVATFKIDDTETDLWNKYAPDRFPVLTWKSAPRDHNGKDTGSVYVFPRTEDGLIKIGYRGIKFTNFVPAPQGTAFTQDGKWSIPLPSARSKSLPEPATEAIRQFVSIFLPEFANRPFNSTKFCWYTDTLDNSFLIDYVPSYDDQSLFVCTGGSGHGAKFLPVLGKHAADIFEHGSQSTSYMYPHWRWREDKLRGNGLEEGPTGPRDLQGQGHSSP
ncbi:unnamed protein product [Clonostachys solani]|uniref:FAD dependent oxidoreductase domain-containing protein n=1 Tax=Clonostachys solani TaxID=160281 RepID=A0A9P0EQH8_9HYPO|nr:unnamed protein product [Clonostachys solani]